MPDLRSALSTVRPDLRRAVVTGWLCLGCLGAGGCGTAGRNYLNENDELRSENLILVRKNQQLQRRLDQRLAQLESLEQRLAGKIDVEGVAPADIPRVVSLVFGRFSGVIDTDGDADGDTVRVYVRPLDQFGRFMPAAGPVELQAVAIRPGRSPLVLASTTLTPKQFGQAYRSGVTGTHFTLTARLSPNRPEEVDLVTVKVVLTDAATGVAVSCQQEMAIGSSRRTDGVDPR